jgi:hypothetical protein
MAVSVCLVAFWLLEPQPATASAATTTSAARLINDLDRAGETWGTEPGAIQRLLMD